MNPEEYGRMFEAEERQWWYAGMRAITESVLSPHVRAGKGRRVLDAGCGTGHNLLHLARHGQPVGLDLSEEALRLARTRGVAVVRGSVLALPFADDLFDLVTSFDVLYHRWVEDDAAAARELARVVRPGGLLLVRVPALRMLWGAHDEAVHSRHRYTRGELHRLLTAAGLSPLTLTYANTLLFPLLAVRRGIDRLTSRHGSDVAFLPAPLEWLFLRALRAEAQLVRLFSLPVGASVFALARKAGGVGAEGTIPA